MLAEYDVVVAGGGPAGLTAALFSARHGHTTLVVDPLPVGGALLNTQRVEDYPGFPEGVAGFDLGPLIQEQADAAGAVTALAAVVAVKPASGGAWRVTTDERELTALALVVATGSRPRKLGIAGEDLYAGKGISHCASCDAPLLRGKRAAVVGGGDSALVETLELADHDVETLVINAADDFVGQASYCDRVRERDCVSVLHATVVEEIVGNGRVTGILVRDLRSGSLSTIEVDSVFVYAGREANTAFLAGVPVVDDNGRVRTDLRMRTDAPGLFGAGDVRVDSAAQAVAAAGDGATAAIAAHQYLTTGEWR